MINADNNIGPQNEIVLGENEMVCSLTNRVVKATDKELTLQSMIAMMTEEYGFAPEDMERDFKVKYEDAESGKTKTQKVDLAIFNAEHAHEADELIRFIIVAKDAKVKSTDKKYGVEATTDNLLLLVSDKTQKSAYLLGSTADFRRLSLLFVQDKPPLKIYEGSGGDIEAFSRRLSQSFSGLFNKL